MDTSTHTPLSAVADVLTLLPDPFHPALDEDDLRDGCVTITPITTPDPRVLVMSGEPEIASILFQVSIRAKSRAQARLAGDTVRNLLCETVRGKPIHPPVADGYVFDPVTTTGDGQYGPAMPDLHAWVETYRLTWQTRTIAAS